MSSNIEHKSTDANIDNQNQDVDCRETLNEILSNVSIKETKIKNEQNRSTDFLCISLLEHDYQSNSSLNISEKNEKNENNQQFVDLISVPSNEYVELTTLSSNEESLNETTDQSTSETQFVELTAISRASDSSDNLCELSAMDTEDEEQFSSSTTNEVPQFYEMSNMETGEQEFCIVSTEDPEMIINESTNEYCLDDSNVSIQSERESFNGSMIIVNNSISSRDFNDTQESITESCSQTSNQDTPESKKRMRRANITERQKYMIEFLHTENGLSAEEIRQHKSLRREDGTKILLKTVKYWLDRLKKTGEMKTKHRSGRPRFLDSEKEKELIKYIGDNSKNNYHIIKQTIHLECTRRTVNNYALRNGIKAYRALKKPTLTDPQKMARLRFVEDWLTREEESKKIIFTDEKLFAGQPTNNHQLVRRKKGERFDEKNINHTHRPNLATSTNVWCYIGPFGKGEIFLAENDEYFRDDGTRIKKFEPSKCAFFNNVSYKNLLEKRALPAIKRQIDDFIFMQDNASIHSALNKDKTDTVIGELLKKENVKTMYWPPLSPDLNPIENVHHLVQIEMNNELTRLEKKPKNKKEVFALLQQSWDRVDNEVVKKIYFSFYGRLSKVKERLGSNNYG